MSRCLDARPGAPRDSAPAADYVVFGPALKKLCKQKFKLVMALPTCRYGSKVLGNLGGFIRNNTTKFGGSKTKLRPRPTPQTDGSTGGSARKRVGGPPEALERRSERAEGVVFR